MLFTKAVKMCILLLLLLYAFCNLSKSGALVQVAMDFLTLKFLYLT